MEDGSALATEVDESPKKKRVIKNRPEQELERAVRLALGRETDLVLWNNKRGSLDRKGQWRMTPGLCTGAADLIGVGPGGRFFALELKAGKSKSNAQTEADQAKFLALVRKKGGFAAKARSVEEAIAALERCRAGLSE